MKTQTRLIISSFLFLFSCCNLDAQAIWPTAMDYKLQGNIKSWTITDESGNILREQKFRNLADQIAFQDQEAGPKYSKRIQPAKMKSEYEKIYDKSEISVDSTVKMIFNERMQLIEKQTGNTHEWNKFSDDGQIITHTTTETTSEVIVGGGVKTRNPKNAFADYVFSYTTSNIVIFKYNDWGSLLEFECYNSNPAKNVRVVYTYDEYNNLVESNRFDHNNISWTLLPDDYLEKFIHTDINKWFLIDNYYPDYWCEGTPLKETWIYNTNNQKIRYVLFNGYMHSPGFEVLWHYNIGGWVDEERQYEITPNELLNYIVFDSHGNVIQETEYAYWEKTVRRFYYLIDYY